MPEFKVGDKVTGPHGLATVTINGRILDIRYDNGVLETVKAKDVTPYVDPRDAEIERLKAQLAQAQEWAGILEKSAETLQTTIHTQAVVIDTLRKINVDVLGPMEAMTKLYELKRLAGK